MKIKLGERQESILFVLFLLNKQFRVKHHFNHGKSVSRNSETKNENQEKGG